MDPGAPAALLGLLPEQAGNAASILVVPDWGAAHPISGSPGLVRELRAHGGELVLHGLTHLARPKALDRLWFGTENHSEFSGLDRLSAKLRIREAAGAFKEALGRAPGWFCAPRWAGRGWLEGLLWEEGFGGLMTRGRYILRSGKFLHLPVVSFDHGKRAAVSLGARIFRRRLCRSLLDSGRPFRLVLHPADLSDPAILCEIGLLCSELRLKGWTPLSIRDIIAP